jgi:uncharacterized protein YcbX
VQAVHVSRIGFTPLKGTRHTSVDETTLEPSGPPGDRVFCLVDLEPRRVLRSVENPSLVEVRSSWDGHTLTVVLPDGSTVRGAPYDEPGDALRTDYWGRPAMLRLQAGPHAEALSDHLGRPVRLARATPGEVVYGAAVSIVTTAALKELAARAGSPQLGTQDARFRATFTLDTDGSPGTLSAGTRIALGRATVEVRGPIPRCAVVDRDPVTGQQTAAVLRTLAGYRRRAGEVYFGVDARVIVPGGVRQGDPAVVEG